MKSLFKIAVLLCVFTGTALSVRAQMAVPPPIPAYQPLSYQQLDQLLGPIALYPSCSQYAIEAIERFGIVCGIKKAVCRILRCSPATDGGYDPVR